MTVIRDRRKNPPMEDKGTNSPLSSPVIQVVRAMRSEPEIRKKFEEIRELYYKSVAESLEFAKTAQDRNQDNFWEKYDKQRKRYEYERMWISETAILEWLLNEKRSWKTSWEVKL